MSATMFTSKSATMSATMAATATNIFEEIWMNEKYINVKCINLKSIKYISSFRGSCQRPWTRGLLPSSCHRGVRKYQQHHKSDNDERKPSLCQKMLLESSKEEMCVNRHRETLPVLGCNIFSDQNLSQNFQNRLDSRGLGDPVFSDNVNNSVIIWCVFSCNNKQ